MNPAPAGTGKKMTRKTRFIIGVDIGGTKMLAVVLDEKFKPLGRSRKKTRTRKKDAPLFDRLCECVAEAMEQANVEPANLIGIGVGSPGPLDPTTGVIIDTPNIGWKNFPLADKLAARFKAPAVVDNDVNLGVYGEFHFGSAKGGRHVFGIFPGTGIGGGIIINGAIYHGASGAAGEIGHVITNPDGPLCGCGRHGCLEAFSGRLMLSGQLAGMVLRGQAPRLAELCGSDIRRIRSSQIAESVKVDKSVEAVVRREASRIGVALAGVVNLLSPDTVVLGGGLVEAMPALFVGEATRAIKDHALPFLAKFVKVTPAKLGDDAVVMGAAKLLVERLGEVEGKKAKTAKAKSKK